MWVSSHSSLGSNVTDAGSDEKYRTRLSCGPLILLLVESVLKYSVTEFSKIPYPGSLGLVVVVLIEGLLVRGILPISLTVGLILLSCPATVRIVITQRSWDNSIVEPVLGSIF